ncbi:hypothetical protein SHKM778_34320 [Streptomyces sp. KM77-8]|uniref:Uncharacterized protein n=1 Tax=Streptomyces haneummycinicus TaxID=3074435 RepID=A0AAT9HIP2_9ACTN
MRGLLHGGARPHVDALFPQHGVGRAGEAFVQFGQDPVGDVEEQPAWPHTGAHRVTVDLRVGEQLSVRGDFGAGVAGTDHDERTAGRAPLGVVGLGGQLHLAGHVVAQIQRLGQAAEAVGVFGDTGNREQFVDTAGGEDQAVVAEGAALALRAGVVHLPGVEIDAVGLPSTGSTCGSVPERETVTRRGSRMPAATWGSRGR